MASRDITINVAELMKKAEAISRKVEKLQSLLDDNALPLAKEINQDMKEAGFAMQISFPFDMIDIRLNDVLAMGVIRAARALHSAQGDYNNMDQEIKDQEIKHKADESKRGQPFFYNGLGRDESYKHFLDTIKILNDAVMSFDCIREGPNSQAGTQARARDN